MVSSYLSNPAVQSYLRQGPSPSASMSVWVKIDQAFELTAWLNLEHESRGLKQVPTHAHTQWAAEDLGPEALQAH